MFRRLFLALFLIGLTLSSMAVPMRAEAALPNCHSIVPADALHHQPDADEGKAAGHLCIGCAANSAPAIAAVLIPLPALLPPAGPMTALAGANAPPSIPPPRS